MQHELVLKVITQGTIGIVFLALLLGLLCLLWKDIRANRRLSGIVVFALAMLALWSFGAFVEVYVTVREMIVTQYTF